MRIRTTMYLGLVVVAFGSLAPGSFGFGSKLCAQSGCWNEPCFRDQDCESPCNGCVDATFPWSPGLCKEVASDEGG